MGKAQFILIEQDGHLTTIVSQFANEIELSHYVNSVSPNTSILFCFEKNEKMFGEYMPRYDVIPENQSTSSKKADYNTVFIISFRGDYVFVDERITRESAFLYVTTMLVEHSFTMHDDIYLFEGSGTCFEKIFRMREGRSSRSILSTPRISPQTIVQQQPISLLG